MVVCVVRGEGGSFYSPRRSVPARNKYGNIWEPPYVDKIILPAKTRVIWRQHGAGRPCGSASPRVPPFVLDTAWWAPILCMSVLGLCMSVFSIKWTSFGCVTQQRCFCVSLLCLLRIFMLFLTCVPAINNSPTLVEFVRNNSYHYC